VTTQVAESLAGLLPSFLPAQRWFGDKARPVAACEVEDFAPLPGPARALVVVVVVRFADRTRHRYSLVVAVRAAAGALPVVGRLAGDDWLVEAAADPAAAAALIGGCAADGALAMARGGLLRYADASNDARRTLGDAIADVAPLGAEQSNTSLRVGRRFVFKLFRRLDVGENPEVEVGRFLTSQTGFRAMPLLEGSVTYVTSSGESSTIGVLQQWVASTGDGWRYTLARLEAVRRSTGPVVDLRHEINRLGAVTADFHAALGSSRTAPAFAPEPVRASDVDTWTTEIHAQANDALALLDGRTRDWPPPARQLAVEVRARVPAVLGDLAVPPVEAAGAFSRIRIHGDYHLGQTLKTPHGFVLIDFEGEPAIPIARRRQKHCALKDVAGMLRSFDYAVETACADGPETADELRATTGLGEAFLDGYVTSAVRHGSTSIPADPTARRRWLALFEFGKALYEMEYEINNRPAWVHIPLRGVLRALDGLDGDRRGGSS